MIQRWYSLSFNGMRAVLVYIAKYKLLIKYLVFMSIIAQAKVMKKKEKKLSPFKFDLGQIT